MRNDFYIKSETKELDHQNMSKRVRIKPKKYNGCVNSIYAAVNYHCDEIYDRYLILFVLLTLLFWFHSSKTLANDNLFVSG